MHQLSNSMAICLWFNNEAEAAANFYLSIFKGGTLGHISRYGADGAEFHHRPPGTAMAVEFSLPGMSFIALNGGPQFVFNEAISVVVYCNTQEEIDHYWDNLTRHGEPGPCGWLKDKYGVSWQIVSSILRTYLLDPDATRRQRVTAAFLKMKKFDMELLQKAYHDAEQ